MAFSVIYNNLIDNALAEYTGYHYDDIKNLSNLTIFQKDFLQAIFFLKDFPESNQGLNKENTIKRVLFRKYYKTYAI